jgi:hypothetical protein
MQVLDWWWFAARIIAVFVTRLITFTRSEAKAEPAASYLRETKLLLQQAAKLHKASPRWTPGLAQTPLAAAIRVEMMHIQQGMQTLAVPDHLKAYHDALLRFLRCIAADMDLALTAPEWGELQEQQLRNRGEALIDARETFLEINRRNIPKNWSGKRRTRLFVLFFGFR